MKKSFLLLCTVVLFYNCKAQVSTINKDELTINEFNIIGENASELIKNFNQPNNIENFLFEMDDVMAEKYNYNGAIFYIVDNKVNSFELSNANFSITKHHITVGDSIEFLKSIYPLSYANKGSNWLSLSFNDIDQFISILFDNNFQITKISMVSN